MTGIDDRSGQNSGRDPGENRDSPAEQLGQALRSLIKDSGKSYSQLAPEVPCGRSTIADAVSCDPQRVPSPKIIEGICRACGADQPTTTRMLALREAIKTKEQTATGLSLSALSSEDLFPSDPVGGDPPIPPEPPAADSLPPSSPAAPASPGPSARAGWKWWLVVTCVVVLVATGVATGVIAWREWSDGCGVFSGMWLNDNADGECVGITDGGYLFNNPSTATNNNDRTIIERINDIERRIETENNAAASSGQYVKVVFLAPLTASHDKNTLSVTTLGEIWRSLEGSYTALYRANHSSSFGDLNIKIQLLLANQGSQQNSDPDFLNLILKASEPSHPVVAVIGLGSSLPSLKTAAEYLADHGIPMVSAVASADNLTPLPLLWSVSPSNTEYVNRIRSFLQTNEEKDTLKSGIIVYDLNPDYYTQTLAQDYHSDDLKPYVKFPDQGFRGATQRGPAQPDVFVPIVTNLCNAANDPRNPLNMVFYAGRSVDLKAFSEALATRTCKNQALTVLTATSAFPSVLESVQQVIQGSNVKVVVATSADPAASGYPDFLKAYQTLGFKEEDIDGYTIEHHDALATAAKAIRLAAQGRPTQLPTAQDVTVQLGNLNLSYAVPGASGTLSFQPQGGRATRPPGQSIPIKQIR
jgi:ABC-type branched-subunit amino acid transport system substrate-binding protein